VTEKLPVIYLDHNATTPPHPVVVAAMFEAASSTWGNSSSVHQIGRLARERIEQVRATIARAMGAHPRDLLFTSGGTEANNLALFDAPAIVTSRLEHPSITRVAEAVEKLGRKVRFLPVTPHGQIDHSTLDETLAQLPKGTVVAVQAVNHETGVVQPLEAISAITTTHQAWLHIDAVQAVGKLENLRFCHGDSYSIAAHKFRGPKGIGALIWRCGRPAPKPLLRGGSQQRGFRPGTLDPISVIGFGAAWERLSLSPSRHNQIAPLRDRLEAQLASVAISNFDATAFVPERLSHVSSLWIPQFRGEELVAALDLEGVCISSGSACSAGTAEASPVITAMYSTERALETVRVSLGEETTREEIDRAVVAFHRVLSRR